MTLGEKMHMLRRNAGLSQDALAEKLEVSRQAVSKWERDEAMPETEKVIRIARLFDVSLDVLLLDREPRDAGQSLGSSGYTDVKRAFRRHGYKLGYVLMVLGLMICVLSLLLWQIWPVIGTRLTQSFLPDTGTELTNPYFGKYTVIVGGEEREITEIPEFMIEKAMREQGGFSEESNLDSMFENMLRAQSGLFLIGLLPGGMMTACGIVIVILGKKRAGRESDI